MKKTELVSFYESLEEEDTGVVVILDENDVDSQLKLNYKVRGRLAFKKGKPQFSLPRARSNRQRTLYV
jgi:hypothetical protein